MLAFLIAFLLSCGIVAPSVAATCDLDRSSTSRWSIETRDGIAWLRTPCGDRFYSVGINGVNGGSARPGKAGHVGYLWSARHPSFGDWLGGLRTRMRAWGFNTAGSTSLGPDVLEVPVIPDLQLGQNASFHWVDPFSTVAEEQVRATAARLVRPFAGSPFRIGYFTDNEIGWWSGALFSFYFRQPASNVTKQRLVEHVREAYAGEWARFVADFIPPPGVSSFDDLLRQGSGHPRLRAGGEGMRVVRSWTGLIADRYYRVVHDAVRGVDPDALLFGDRLPIYYDPAAVRAMARWVDVISTNYNVDSGDGWIAPYFFDGLRAASGGRPVLISEWFFAAEENRTGNENNGHLMTVATQAERAKGAAAAAVAFARQPNVVGSHWFQLYDHPKGGRPDGEDYNFGLLDVEDRPYEVLTAALAGVNARLPEIHAAAAAKRAKAVDIPRATIDVGDRSLSDWPKDRALVVRQQTPATDVPFGDALLAWDARGLALATVSMDYHAPELIPPHEELSLADTFHTEIGVDTGEGPRRFVVAVIPPADAGSADYTMRARLCRSEGAACTPVDGGLVTYFGSDQPRIVIEALLPWSALGLDGPPAGPIRMELTTTGFHRARWMSWSGRPPAEALADESGWRSMRLANPAPVAVTTAVR